MKVYIGSDHTGYDFKQKLIDYLEELGYKTEDKGCFTFDTDDDYPDFVKPVAEAVANDPGSMGIVMGGSGQGEAICANKVKGIRSAVFYGPHEALKEVDVAGRKSNDPFEIVKLAREHNDANVLSLAMRFVSEDDCKFAIRLFLSTRFEGEERHVRRLFKIED